MSALPLTITTAGLERFTAAQIEDDIDLTISSVGLTNEVFVPAPTLTALPGQFREVDTISGDQVDDYIVHLMIRDDADLTYTVRGFGLFLADGTLFAVYGQELPIFEKAAPTAMLIAIDMAFPSANIDALSFGETNFLNPPATTARMGVVELATELEAIAGEDGERAITPRTMKAAIDAERNANDPIGSTKLWWGTVEQCPQGWAVCHGQTVARSDGTGNITLPDTRGRAPVGASVEHALGALFGASTKTVASAAAGAHTPAGTLPAHNHAFDGTGTAAAASTGITLNAPLRDQIAGGGSGTAVDFANLNDPGHSHSVSVSGSTANTGPLNLTMTAVPAHQHNVTVDVTPPSIAFHIIMRI